MRRSLPPLTWFRSFEAAARTLSFTAAAEEIGLTQSAVSQQVRALEVSLDTPLFHRRPRGLALTDAGRMLLPEVEAALDTLKAATARHAAPPAETAVTVAASISVLEWVIAPNLATFTARHPGLTLHLKGTIWPDEFAAPRADVEIRFGSARQVGEGAQALPTTLAALRSPALEGPFEALPKISAAGTSVGWAEWCETAGVALRPPSLIVDSYGLALRLAAEGQGVALANAALAARALATGRLVTAHPATVTGKEGYFLSVTTGREAARHFGDWIRHAMGG